MSIPQQPRGVEPAIGVHGPVVLVASPHSGNALAGDPGVELAKVGVAIGERLNVQDLDRPISLGTTWRERGYAAAIAAGGDGTIGAVASHLAGSNLPLGILPLGTSNDVARSLGMPLDLAQACAAIAHGVETAVDVGLAAPAVTEPGALARRASESVGAAGDGPADSTGAAPRAYFLHALTLGFNVQFARLATDVARRERWGPLNYATSVLEALAHFQPVEVTLRLTGVQGADGKTEMEEQVVSLQAVQVAVVNTPVFGGGLNLRLPDVGLNDELLDFVVIEALDANVLRGTVEGLLGALNSVGNHLRERMAQLTQRGEGAPQPEQSSAQDQARADEAAGLALPGVRRYKARSAIIETHEPLDLTLDGEIRARTPARISISPDPLRVLLPEEARAALAGIDAPRSTEKANERSR